VDGENMINRGLEERYQPIKPTVDVAPPQTGWNWNPLGSRFPSTPEQFVSGTLATPAVGGGGALIGGGTRIITKTGIKFLPVIGGAIAGLFAGSLLGGGGQEQEMTVKPTVTPTQITEVSPYLDIITRLTNMINQTTTVTPTVGDIADSHITGGVGSTQTQETVYNISNIITRTIQPTVTKSHQTTTTTTIAGQTAKQGLDLLTMALIGGIGLLAYEMFK
jgi:hypothetical protein